MIRNICACFSKLKKPMSLFFGLFVVWCIFMYPKLSQVRLEYVVVHFDFKGMPPKLSYLREMLPILKSHGVNALLMEYEDMFPYRGNLTRLSAVNRYSQIELRNFLEAAHHLEFEIIPFIQTFGHMEFALKLQEFSQLQESLNDSCCICPSKIDSKNLIKEMLKQVIEFHRTVVPLKHLHIGCDEVYHLNKCTDCKARNMKNIELYVDHVNYVAGLVTDFSPDTNVLIWDDMLRTSMLWELKSVEKFPKVEPVYWDYSKSVSLNHASLRQYRKTFSNIWIASAFKGADGMNSLLPKLHIRAENTLSWMYSILFYQFGGEKKVFDFKGIILTGWSRYSHFNTHCDILTAALPSLFLNLIIINQFKTGTTERLHLSVDELIAKYIGKKVQSSLSCPPESNIAALEFDLCTFNGSKLYQTVKTLDFKINMVKKYKRCKKLSKDLNHIRKSLVASMSMYYERRIIDEYVNKIWFQVNESLNKCLKSGEKHHHYQPVKKT